MAYRKSSSIFRRQPGPKIALLPGDGVRQQIRRHLRRERMAMADVLPQAWRMTKTAAYRVMYDVDRALKPEFIVAFSQAMGLEDDDRKKLMLAGAREAGWEI